MAKLQITELEAKLLIARTKAAEKEGRLLDVIMPNGKPMKDCTGAYIAQLAEAMTELGLLMEAGPGTKH
jgi:hypothetical protein